MTNYRKYHGYNNCMTAASYQTTVAIDMLPDTALDQLLEKFYPSLRNKNGEKDAVQSLRSILAGIQRYYTEPPCRRQINIISGENFTRSKAMFEAVCVDLKKSGLGDVTHKPVINDEDMAKICDYFKTWKTDPVVLIRTVWFDLMIFCCRRGREGLRELSKTSYVVDCDGWGQKFIKKNGSELTKNHRTDVEDSSGGIIYDEKDSDLCPVASYTFYLGKLNPNCDVLFQRPRPNYHTEDETWFENKPLGKNTLGALM